MSRSTRVQDVVRVIRKISTTNAPTQRFPPRLESVDIPSKTTSSAVAEKRSQAAIRWRALPWVFSSLLAGGIAFYGGALLVEARKPLSNPNIANLSHQKDVSRRYDDTADSFDSEVGISEVLMGINSIRKKLAEQCIGDVLEVSCGTGRNLGYYDIGSAANIDSLTFVDLSPQMVEVCKKKWNVLFGNKTNSNQLDDINTLKPGLVIRFLTASALETMPPPPKKQKYDTVIQTMGLCSTPAPKELLLNMIKHLDTSNPEARILLLEHGRSHRSWLNNILDNAAEKHAEIHGCWFNRDIGAIVEDAARLTGLEVVSEKRHHFGTTWVFELRPSSRLVKQSVPISEGAVEQSRQTGWFSWLGLR